MEKYAPDVRFIWQGLFWAFQVHNFYHFFFISWNFKTIENGNDINLHYQVQTQSYNLTSNRAVCAPGFFKVAQTLPAGPHPQTTRTSFPTFSSQPHTKVKSKVWPKKSFILTLTFLINKWMLSSHGGWGQRECHALPLWNVSNSSNKTSSKENLQRTLDRG